MGEVPRCVEGFARWFGVAEKPAREAMAAHADELVVAAIDGTPAWVTPAGADAFAGAAPARGVVLLGGFDPYVLAPISHRAAIIPEGHLGDVSRTAGWISAAVLVDGFVAGTWTHGQTPDGTTIDVQPFAPLAPGVVDELTARAQALGRRLLPGPVTVRIAATVA
jgi:hypothetical protein